jgi:hypothetical protein
MGLAFFRIDAGGHPVVEHQGLLPGFDSQILLAPDDGVGVVAFTNGTRLGGLWLPAESGRLLDDLIGVPHPGVRGDVPHHPEIWADLCGWYALPGPVSDVRVRAALGAGMAVTVRHGRPHLRILGPVPAQLAGYELHPDDPEDPYAFRIDLLEAGLVTARVVFGQDPSGRTTALHLDLMPLSAVKRPVLRAPRHQDGATLAVAARAVVLRRRPRDAEPRGRARRGPPDVRRSGP